MADKEAIHKRVKELFAIVEEEAKIRKKKRPPTSPNNAPRYDSYAPVQSAKRRNKPRKPGAITEGPVVTLKELAFDHKITPKELRRILRKAGISRPSGRWEWAVGSDEANRIQQIIARRKKS